MVLVQNLETCINYGPTLCECVVNNGFTETYKNTHSR